MDLTPERGERVSFLPIADQARMYLEEREMKIVSISNTALEQIWEAAYRAGREDAARAVEEFGDPIICHECGPDVVGFAAAARSTSLGRSSQGVGDNPEEQQP